MKIYQVEKLVGITKKNIRFYEEQGLITPKRNPDNDYRDYSLSDVQALEKIKLLRKLYIPIEEIRLLESGSLTLAQSMKEQIVRIEKEMQNAEVIKELCKKLHDETLEIESLDAQKYLKEMKKMEEQGTKFADIEKEDINKKKKTGAVVGAAIFSTLMIIILAAMFLTVQKERQALVPLFFTGALILCLLTGTAVMLFYRFREIERGEEYDARKY